MAMVVVPTLIVAFRMRPAAAPAATPPHDAVKVR
jgi:hypothetical protein